MPWCQTRLILIRELPQSYVNIFQICLMVSWWVQHVYLLPFISILILTLWILARIPKDTDVDFLDQITSMRFHSVCSTTSAWSRCPTTVSTIHPIISKDFQSIKVKFLTPARPSNGLGSAAATNKDKVFNFSGNWLCYTQGPLNQLCCLYSTTKVSNIILEYTL